MLRPLAAAALVFFASTALADSRGVNFNTTFVGTSLNDAYGVSTGLTHRLPGTGTNIPEHDPNFVHNLAEGTLDIQSQNGDLASGVNLADLDLPGWYIDGRPTMAESFFLVVTFKLISTA